MLRCEDGLEVKEREGGLDRFRSERPSWAVSSSSSSLFLKSGAELERSRGGNWVRQREREREKKKV